MRSRLLIVDDHDGFRAVARAMLEADGFTVVGEAVDGEGAIAGAAALRPDVVLLDVQLPDMDGFEVARRLATLPTPAAVVLISSRPIADVRRRTDDAPVVGFLAKHELSGSALNAMVAVTRP